MFGFVIIFILCILSIIVYILYEAINETKEGDPNRKILIPAFVILIIVILLILANR